MKKIVKGNDFTLRIPVMKMVEGQAQAFPLPACTDIAVQVCNQFRRIPLAFTIDVKEDNVLLARVEGDKMSLGTYAIEVKGKIFGNDWRSNEYPQFSIVAKNADSDTEFGETDDGDNSVEMDTAMVILPPSVELSDLINKANDAMKTNKETNDTLNANESARKEAEAQRVTAESERVSAEQTRVSAEETRVSAESDRANAERGRELAEFNRIEAERVRVENENTILANERTRNDNEHERVNSEILREHSEEERVTAENSRANSEVQRVSAENEREFAENGRSSAEAERVQAEKKRQTDTSVAIGSMTDRINTAIDEFNAHRTEFDEAEAQRVGAENSRVEAETARANAEKSRVTSENERATAETDRAEAESNRQTESAKAVKAANDAAAQVNATNESIKTNEQGRVDAETNRESAEKSRNDKEGIRQENETERISQETERQTNEQKRVEAENKRIKAEKQRNEILAQAKSDCETAAQAASSAADDATAAKNKAENAASGAEKVNATLTEENVFEVTGRTGVKKTLDLSGMVSAQSDVARIQESMGAYSDRPDITLVAKETNKAISADGVKVTKAGWAIAEFTAEKGNIYLFKPNVIDGSVCVFAEYITSIETRGIDYTYTYNEDGTIATATATYRGNTHTYTYEWTVEAGVNIPTIKEGNTVIKNLPMTYETKVGTYSPLIKLNENAELPVDGYCRYMSHFKGNSSIKIVVSYKVGIADLTMKVLRDDVLASISTQLGNLSQKEDETRKKIEEYHGSYAEFMFNDDTSIIVDGKGIIISARVKTRVYPKKSLVVGDRFSKKTLIYADVANLDTSGFTTFYAMFANCNILSELNLSAWDTSQVTSMSSMFYGCSGLTSLNLSAWDTTSLGKGVKESVKETGIYMMFYGSNNIKTLDMGGDGWNFVNIPSSISFYRALESAALTEWKLGKNFFKGRFVNQYYNSNSFNNWTKASFIESIVTNSYDRRANGYEDVTLYFNEKLKGYLSEENIATMTAKGYIIA